MLALTCVVGCSSPEFAPDAIVSNAGGSEVTVRSWEFCGPAEDSYECLDSLPEDDLPTLVVQSNGSWKIDRPDGYKWDITYSTGEPGKSSPVLFLGDRDGDHITEIPQPGTYLVEMRGRTDDTVGVWTFEVVVQA